MIGPPMTPMNARHAKGKHPTAGAWLALVVALLLQTGTAAVAASPDPPVSLGRGYDEQTGERLYQGICQACHMSRAEGASGAGAYPALRANPRVASSGYVMLTVLHGRRGMPEFGTELSDDQIAQVVNYLRSHFDNHYANEVSPADVSKLR
jgi:mono/diheme cytochrome c family protein